MAYPLQDVINWFLSKEAMTPKKLQKILYYAYSWTLTMENDSNTELDNKLFDAKFEAWVHGPVIREVYDSFREYGYNEIPQYEGPVSSFSADIEEILEDVWDEYGEYNGNELESITHQEDPWLNARSGYSALERCNVEISDEQIFNYYIQRVEYVD
ncbi:Panacea domain-containing protein [Fictibacillus phosphorivorans]|uniref:Panacea domain-containing protein n=1 Tax=Fictibacillus phosphorivorans TaxID=1221500 RepID=UPI0011A2763A|nr:type II toxin-antitoxin system antitoxin SocA domain-containing protein [Fictibacillus phosphorivorans]